MSESLLTLLHELEALAAYDGPWRVLREQSDLLQARIAELREREQRLDDVLVVALVGGSGVGKSTLLNAIAGDQIAKTSEMRPCTALPTVYHPPGTKLHFKEWDCVARSALERLVLIDTPDSDTVVREHRAIVEEALGQCDLILLCGSAEKYLDEATWSLLRPLQGQRTMVCVETKAGEADDIQAHWRERLEEQGFNISDYFRVNALHALDRKLGGANRGEEYDFAQLEAFLRKELSVEQISRIKRSNAAGLLRKTVLDIHERTTGTGEQVQALSEQINEADKAVARDAFELVKKRLFSESHLWTYALGREVSLRSKGFVGTLFRVLEGIRSLPARLPEWLTFKIAGSSSGRKAAALLTEKELVTDDIQAASESVVAAFNAKQSEVALAQAQAGFDRVENKADLEAFKEVLNHRLVAVMRGPARDRIVSRARFLTGWFMTTLLDAPPLAFIAYSGYKIVRAYFEMPLLDTAFFYHAGTVLLILLGAELLIFSLLTRFLAWGVRRGSIRTLQSSLFAPGLAFVQQKEWVNDTQQALNRIEALHERIANATAQTKK